MFKPNQEYKEKLQRYEQVLVEAIQQEALISDNTRNSLKRWQRVLRLADEDIEAIEARVQHAKEHFSKQSIIICACWLL